MGDQRPSSFCMRLTSALATLVSLPRLRLWVEDLCSSRWRALAFSRMSLPEPVPRTRFLVPEWVLFFGICLFPLLRLSGLRAGREPTRGLGQDVLTPRGGLAEHGLSLPGVDQRRARPVVLRA